MKVGDLTKSFDDLRNKYIETGAQSGFANSELLGSGTRHSIMDTVTQPLNRLQERSRNWTAHTEDMMRMAHWTDVLKQVANRAEHLGGGIHTEADFEKAAQEATQRVMKYNLNFSDMTQAESNIRRLVPFYSFMRKNIPLQFENFFTHPGRMSVMPKGMTALQQVLGTDPQHLPMTEAVPGYLKDLANEIRLQGPGQENIFGKLLGGTKNAIYGQAPLPPAQLGNLADTALGQVTPLMRIPIELHTGKSLTTGASIPSSKLQYFANQQPLTRAISQAINPPQPNRVILPGERLTSRQQPLLNLAAPFNLKEITTQTQLSELKRQQQPIANLIRTIMNQKKNAALRAGR
jgi:hypothetical protein